MFAALVFGVTAVAFKMHRHEQNQEIAKPSSDDSTGLLDNIKKKISGTTTSSDESTADLSKLDFELQRIALEIEFAQTKQSVHHFESAQADWSELVGATLSDSVGKRIAGNEGLLLQFLALRQMPAPSKPEPVARDILARLNEIQNGANDATNISAINRLRAALAETKQFTFVSFAFHQARLNQLQRIREAAVSHPEGEFELHATISLRAAALTNELTSVAEKAARDVQASIDEELRQLSKQRDEAADVVAKLNSQLARLARRERLDSQVESENTEQLVSRDDYNRELESIRTDLVAFTTPGYVQPESADKLVYHNTKRPFSYTALKRIGALEDSETGLAILLRVGGSKTATQQNDRPLGSFPRMNSISELRKPNVVARLKEAQRLLRQYGQLMVEDGLLSP
ncbi:hypothetical protein [Crateriforma conspicua]|uniref:hypothetical protein n=1 Tax=Crateriforma conspicua TaxID=2527996 RepID=UPI0011B6B2BA|nr:hypothetical protein [Crateriforma conspicua]